MSATRDAERILYKHSVNLWRYCNDPLRRRRYKIVLDKHRTRLLIEGVFTDAQLREIEQFNEEWEGIGE